MKQRSRSYALGLVAWALVLAGCGGDSTVGDATGSPSDSFVESTSPNEQGGDPGLSGSGAAAQSGDFTFPEGFPIDTFPVPPGYEWREGIADPTSGGVAFSFIDVEDKGPIAEFYLTELPKLGYEVSPYGETAFAFSGNGVSGQTAGTTSTYVVGMYPQDQG